MATTESEIVDMSLRLAGAGNQVGLSEAQITSFAAALSSVGLTAEAGGSAISRTFLNINTAVKSGGDAVEGFAKVAGMSSEEFQQAFEKDAANAMSVFLKGLDNINKTGGDTSAVLRDIGIKDTLMIDALQRAAGASDLFSQALETGNTAWDENTALVDEANERYKTYESQVQIMKNAFNELAITVGTPMKDSLAPVVGRLARGAQVINDTLQVLSGNKSLDELNKNTRGAVTAIVQYLDSLKPAMDGIKAVFDIAMDIASLVGGAIAVGFQATLRAIVPLANAIGNLLSLISQIPGLVPAITGLVAAFAAFRTISVIMGASTIAVSAFQTAVLLMTNPVARALALAQVWQRVQMLLNATLLANPIGLVVGVLVGLGTALYVAYTRSETFRNIVDTLFQSIANGASAAVTWMQTAADNIIKFFQQVGVDTATMFKDGFVVGLQNLGTAISTAVQNGISAAQQQVRDVGAYIADLIGGGLSDRISGIFKPFTDQLKFAFENIGGAISYVLPLIGSIGLRMLGVTGPIGLVIGAVLSLVGFFYRLYQTNETFADGVNAVWGGIVSVFQTVMTALQPIFDVFRQAATEFVTVLGPQFAETGEVIRQSFSDLQPTFQELATAFGELGAELSRTWQELLPQIMPLIQELAVSFGQLAQTVIPLLLEVVKQLIGVWVQLAQSYMEIASVVLPLLLSVFMQIFPIILQVVQAVLPIVLQLITSLVPVVMQIVSQILPALLSIVQAVFPVILSIIKAVMPIVLQLIQAIIPIIAMLVETLLPAILSVVQAVFPVILSIIKMVMPVIVQILKLAANIITSILIPAIEFILSIVNRVFPAIMKIIQNVLNIVIGIIKLFTSILKGDWQGAFDAIFSIVKNIFSAIWTTIKTVAGIIVDILRGAWNLLVSITKTLFGNIWQSIVNIFNDIVGTIKAKANEIWNRLNRTWGSIKSSTIKIFNEVKDKITGTFEDIVQGAKDLPGKIGEGIKNAASKVGDGVKAVSGKLLDGIGAGINGVISGVNWVLKKVGSDKQYDKWTIPEYAMGTPTGGHAGGPMIVGDGGLPELVVMPNGRMMLSPATDTLMNAPKGTQVLSGDRTKRMINSITPPFYEGGTGIINTAADLYQKTKNGVKKGLGKAKDVVIDIFDYVKNPGKLISKALEAVGFNGLPDLTGAVGNIMKGGYNKVKDTAVDYVKGLLKESTTFTGKGGSAAVKGWVQQAINIAGVPASWANALETIAMKESGGNPNAFNNWDINAKRGIPSQGLMQTIPPTFNAYKYPGHNNIRNPIDNILAAIGYIKARYGNVFNVPGIRNMAKGLPYVGYATGGFIDQMHMAMVGEGNKKEVVIPLEAKSRMQPFADATAAGIRDSLTGVGGNGETKFEQHNVFTNIVPMTPAEARASQKKAAQKSAQEWGLK